MIRAYLLIKTLRLIQLVKLSVSTGKNNRSIFMRLDSYRLSREIEADERAVASLTTYKNEAVGKIAVIGSLKRAARISLTS